MGRIITLTLLTDLSCCIVLFIVGAIIHDFATGCYIAVMSLGNILLPTLGAVLIYTVIKGWTRLKSTFKTIALQSIILAVVFVVGLFVWATIDVYLYKTIQWENILYDYQTEFSGFLPVVLAEALLIPMIDLWLTKVKDYYYA